MRRRQCSSTLTVTVTVVALVLVVLLLQPPAVTLSSVIQMGVAKSPTNGGYRRGRVIYTRPSKEFIGAHMLRSPNDPNDKCQHGRKVDRWGYCRPAVVFV